MKTVTLPSGIRVPALGQGTWHLGENPATRTEEIATLRLGLDLGLTLIDTAEMYGEGRSEELLVDDDVIVIPKTGHRVRLKDNLGALCGMSEQSLAVFEHSK